MSHGHKVQKCKHGLIVGQCRCPGPKGVEVVACPSDCILGGTPLSMTYGSGPDPVIAELGFHGDECPCQECNQ